MDEILQDKRFAHVVRDPRFHRMARNQRKVKIDKRFKNMFQDKRFKLKYSVDKRGRPVNLTTNENLKKYYELDEDSSDEEDVSDGDSGSEVVERTAPKEDSESGEVSDEQESESDKACDKDSDESDNEEEESKKMFTKIKDSRFKLSEMKTVKDKKTKGGNNKQTGTLEKLQKVSAVMTTKEKQMPGKPAQEKAKLKKFKPVQPIPNVAGSSSGSDEEADDNTDDESEEETEDESENEFESVEKGDDAVDFARGEGNVDSSSSSEEEDEMEDVIGSGPRSEFDHRWGELDDEAEDVSEATSRLAVCNMDWDRIKAKDIYVLLNSFKPTKGLIKSVKVYRSEYGKARMEEEKVQGPRELKELKEERGDSDEETEDQIGTRYHTEKLREYQLNRLKYLYAVVECDSTETADEIYKECDGLEYETSSTKLDLRFIPEDMEFDEEPESVSTSVPPGYKPSLFINTALSQSKVELTWDETDRERVQLAAQQFTGKAKDLKEDDLQAYLASSSDEEGPDYGALVDQSDDSDDQEGGEEAEPEDKQINKYKMLLQEMDKGEKEKKRNDVQMEITWEPGLKETTEGLLKKKEQKGLTPWEEYLEKKKEKKRKKREDKKKKKVKDRLDSDQEDIDEDTTVKSTAADMEEGGQAFSDDELPTGVDFDDPFFSELKPNQKTEKDKKKKKKKKKEVATAAVEGDSEKAALSLLVMDEDDDKEHFSLKKLVKVDEKKKKKKKKKQEDDDANTSDQLDNFQMNVKDPRFAAMYESHLFNIDPSAPEYKKTQGTEAIIEEKLKRRRENGKKKQSAEGKDRGSAKKRKVEDDGVKVKDDSLASLVNSVKLKTKNFQSKKIKR